MTNEDWQQWWRDNPNWFENVNITQQRMFALSAALGMPMSIRTSMKRQEEIMEMIPHKIKELL